MGLIRFFRYGSLMKVYPGIDDLPEEIQSEARKLKQVIEPRHGVYYILNKDGSWDHRVYIPDALGP